ncbi:hypothetical protein QBC34DRAFT_387640 [Podospora aff. communis PSN243]|uniref:Uncharacterized protein n=1 Tax=Podospora aff. communis PSN243 TaxID=3040156 RepID=A0AAV9G0H6_9PEZI|nr:hypothetical protein QBC34DRAFT_387640 [Podospora aff. communis PSN243]
MRSTEILSFFTLLSAALATTSDLAASPDDKSPPVGILKSSVVILYAGSNCDDRVLGYSTYVDQCLTIVPRNNTRSIKHAG